MIRLSYANWCATPFANMELSSGSHCLKHWGFSILFSKRACFPFLHCVAIWAALWWKHLFIICLNRAAPGNTLIFNTLWKIKEFSLICFVMVVSNSYKPVQKHSCSTETLARIQKYSFPNGCSPMVVSNSSKPLWLGLADPLANTPTSFESFTPCDRLREQDYHLSLVIMQ